MSKLFFSFSHSSFILPFSPIRVLFMTFAQTLPFWMLDWTLKDPECRCNQCHKQHPKRRYYPDAPKSDQCGRTPEGYRKTYGTEIYLSPS